MIENRQYRISTSGLEGKKSLAEVVEDMIGPNALRWYVGQIIDDEIIVEVTVAPEAVNRFNHSISNRFYPGKCVALSVIPTGVACDIGGYAGDAAPITNLLASTVDYLVTNPNALNASDFIGLDSNNVVYTDGFSIDLFSSGAADLYLPYSNKVGLIVEKTEVGNLDTVFNILNTVRAVHGVNVSDYVVTDRPIGGRCVKNKSGAITGVIDNPQVLFEACDKLTAAGVDAIAVTSDIQALSFEDYAKHFDGRHPNPVGGVEAIISYSITERYRIPSAHAPLVNLKEMELLHKVVDCRGAGEMASASGLACILIGLKKAPQISPKSGTRVRDIINKNNLLAVVSPESCLGGVPQLHAEKDGIPIIAVEENSTLLNVNKSKLGMRGVVDVRNYAEAAGVLMALRKGISLESIARPLRTIRYEQEKLAGGRDMAVEKRQPDLFAECPVGL
ncbi:MAG: DUF3326 domain-containing protein [Blastocatellia bacterium]